MNGLVVNDLSKEFPARGEPLVVLRGVSLRLRAGENAAIVGPSGSGKSTLLSIVGGLEPPSGGRVALAGDDPWQLDQRRLAQFRNTRVGFVFQDHYLLPQCSVIENVLLPALASGGPSADTIERATMLLERVGLAARREHRPAELSGGERQRAALARALINRPLLVLADEPTGNLDRTAAQNVAELLLELQTFENTILLVVTHSRRLADMMQRRWELNDGRLDELAA